MRPALISTIVEYYNFVDPDSESSFVQLDGNGVSLDLSEIEASGSNDRRARERLTPALQALLASQGVDSQDAQYVVQPAAAAAVWTVQTGEGALSTSGSVDHEVQIGGATQANELDGGAGNDVLVDGAGSGSLDGGADNDVLLGGGGGDTLHGGTGRDYLLGGDGDDFYFFASGDGNDTIRDSDGLGAIFIDAERLSVGRQIAANFYESEDGRYTISRYQNPAYGQTNYATLVMRGEQDDLITVLDWQEGDLDLDFTEPNRIRSLESREEVLAEGGATGLTLDLHRITTPNQVVRLNVGAALASSLRVVTGSQTLSFNANGTLDIQLDPGQSTFTYSLIAADDIDTSSPVALSATLFDTQIA